MVWSQRVLIKIYERASRISSYIPSLRLSPSPQYHPPYLSSLYAYLLFSLFFFLPPSPSHSTPLTTRENSFLSFPPFLEYATNARIRGIRNEPASREFTRLGIGPSIYFTLGSLGAVPPILGGEGFISRVKSDSRSKTYSS